MRSRSQERSMIPIRYVNASFGADPRIFENLELSFPVVIIGSRDGLPPIGSQHPDEKKVVSAPAQIARQEEIYSAAKFYRDHSGIGASGGLSPISDCNQSKENHAKDIPST